MSRRKRAADGSVLGLSEAHIPRKEAPAPDYYAAVWENGELMQLRSAEPQAVPGRGIRGVITGFSAASRRRLLHLFASLDKEKMTKPIFITLTYPGENWKRFGGRKEQVKKHLDTFAHWLVYQYPAAAVVWRQEFQKRGAPHFHLLVFNVQYIDCYRAAFEWYKVVGSNQESHLAVGTEVRGCKSWRQAAAYVAKYLAKPESYSESEVPIHSRPGRNWGCWGKERLIREALIYGLSEEQFFKLRRIMRGFCKAKGYRLRAVPSFSAFVGSAAGHRAVLWVGGEKLAKMTADDVGLIGGEGE